MTHKRFAAVRFAELVLFALVVASCGGGGTDPAPPAGNNNNTTTNNPPGGTGNPPAGAPTSANVTVTDNVFTPSSVTVARNGTITWTWSNSGYGTAHNVTFDGGGGSSGDKTDGTYERTFATAGTFSYRCSNHPPMTGTVIVQ